MFELHHNLNGRSITEEDRLWRSYIDMGSRAWAANEYKNAYRSFHRAHVLACTSKPNSMRIAISKYNLALIYKYQKRYAKSLRYLEKALELVNEVYGDCEVRAPRIFDALGDLYLELGDARKAKRFFEKAQQLDITVRGENDPRVRQRALKLYSMEIIPRPGH